MWRRLFSSSSLLLILVSLFALSLNDAFVPKVPAIKLTGSRGRFALRGSKGDGGGADSFDYVNGIDWTPSYKDGKREGKYGPIQQYSEDLSKVIRRKTRTVECGPVMFGSDHPIVRQTMATTNTADVDATVDQVIR